MRDAERRLLRCMGGIDDELILEANTLRFPPRRWGHLMALAACLALVIAIPMLWKPSEHGTAAESTQKTPDYEHSATEEAVGNTPMEDVLALEPTYNADSIVTTESIGGLKLGMDDQEILDLMGQPNNCIPMDDYDERLERWVYEDLTLVLGTLGDGWFLNEIYLIGSGYTLSSGIGIGSTAKEVETAYPGILGQEDLVWGYVYATNADLNGLYITVTDGLVSSVMLGPWIMDFAMEAAASSILDSLHVNEITIYQWMDKQWQTTTVRDKAAKYICTILTVSEPEEASVEKLGVSMWMDFGNGTLVELLGGDQASVWTRENTDVPFDPFKTDGLIWHFGGVFDGLDGYVEQALADPDAGWEDAPKKPVIYEGAEAEP